MVLIRNNCHTKRPKVILKTLSNRRVDLSVTYCEHNAATRNKSYTRGHWLGQQGEAYESQFMHWLTGLNLNKDMPNSKLAKDNGM